MSWEIRQGDALERLREMPDKSIHVVICSPPYWGLRDYGTATWEGGDPACPGHRGRDARQSPAEASGPKSQSNAGSVSVYSGDCACGARRVDRQIGLEETPAEYIGRLLEVFREVGRVLRDDGLLFVNLGDSYAANRTYQVNGTKQTDKSQPALDCRGPAGLRPKSLVGIPWRFALAMIDEGWILRNEIIWAKGASFNPKWAGAVMPESVQDRFTKSHETIFMFSKQERYFFDMESVKEENASEEQLTHNQRYAKSYAAYDTRVADTGQPGNVNNVGIHERGGGRGRQPRTVWAIGTKPSIEAHYAMWPEKLVATMIKCSTSEKGVCPACGAPYRRVVEKTAGAAEQRPGYTAHCTGRNDGERPGSYAGPQITGMRWEAGCTCKAGDPVPATVLDPFSGAASTGVASLKLGRHYLGLELSPEYVTLSERRLRQIDAYQPSLL